MKETELMNLIRFELVETGKYSLWRNNIGFDQVTKVRYGLGVGTSDLVGFRHRDGRFIGLEIKTATGRASKEQKMWIEHVVGHGGLAGIVHSTEDALKVVER